MRMTETINQIGSAWICLKIHCVLKASVMILGIQREFSILLLQWMNFTSVVYGTDKIKIWFMQGLI